jgi:hypothetical protein
MQMKTNTHSHPPTHTTCAQRPTSRVTAASIRRSNRPLADGAVCLDARVALPTHLLGRAAGMNDVLFNYIVIPGVQ